MFLMALQVLLVAKTCRAEMICLSMVETHTLANATPTLTLPQPWIFGIAVYEQNLMLGTHCVPLQSNCLVLLI